MFVAKKSLSLFRLLRINNYTFARKDKKIEKNEEIKKPTSTSIETHEIKSKCSFIKLTSAKSINLLLCTTIISSQEIGLCLHSIIIRSSLFTYLKEPPYMCLMRNEDFNTTEPNINF